MVRFTKKVKRFIADYERQHSEIARSASRLEGLIKSFVEDSSADVHLVTSRAKEPDSLRSKLRRKKYPDPARELTDRIGVRIITYYRNDVDIVVEKLKGELEVDQANSVDKRQVLDLRTFGYRSVHLIARLKGSRAEMPEYKPLKGVWFEVQIRSILEHAWAEIEHEVVYKSGIKFPPEALRQFAALAGTLEILDGEFLTLRAVRSRLIELYRDRYARRLDANEELDAARLLGLLEACYPDGISWRRATDSGFPFPMHMEACCVDALRAVGLKTALALRSAMTQARYRSAIRNFAALKGIGSDEVSHLALIVIMVALKDENVVRTYFPQMLRDESIERLLATRAGKRRRRA
jgi:ppGpp synthetase/RelA/SpoT-type nucleotidyltranferase